MSMQLGEKGGITADINVTPLIDVVLVLLIIFMVITPMLQKGRPVQLPEGMDPAKKPDNPDDIIVSLEFVPTDPDRPVIYYRDDKLPIEKERLAQQLQELHERDPSMPLFIKADKRLRYGRVKETMLLCNAAGFGSVNLVAEAARKGQ